VRALAAPGDQARDSAEPAWGLFADREAIERSMTEVIRKRIAEQHGVLVPVESAPSSAVAPA